MLNATDEVLLRAVQNAALLVQMGNMGVSNEAELRHLLTLFAGFQTAVEGHRLSALAFGAQQAQHFSFGHIRESERIDLGHDDEPPMEYSLAPRTRTYKPRMERTGFADKSAEKTAQRPKILEEERALRREVMG